MLTAIPFFANYYYNTCRSKEIFYKNACLVKNFKKFSLAIARKDPDEIGSKRREVATMPAKKKAVKKAKKPAKKVAKKKTAKKGKKK